MLYQNYNNEIRLGNSKEIGLKLSSRPGNYLLKRDMMSGEFYLSPTLPFKLPEKIYGDTSVIQRWLKSYEINSSKNMGILLSGLKGAGKTILAQKLCIDSNKPVIIITEPYGGSSFIEFMSNPAFEDCIIFIDEFEKLYSDDVNTDLLSLFDGNLMTRFLFLTTVNEISYVSKYMINRPSRIKYRKHYDNLERDVIIEVIDDLLINKNEKDGLLRELSLIGIITYDILISLIKDMNLFNESAINVIKHFNVKSETQTFVIKELYKGKEYYCDKAFINIVDGDFDISFSCKHLNRLHEVIGKHSFNLELKSSSSLKERDENLKQFLVDSEYMSEEEFDYSKQSSYAHFEVVRNLNDEDIEYNNHNMGKIVNIDDTGSIYVDYYLYNGTVRHFKFIRPK